MGELAEIKPKLTKPVCSRFHNKPVAKDQRAKPSREKK